MDRTPDINYNLEGPTKNPKGQVCWILLFWKSDDFSSLELTHILDFDFSFLPYLFLSAILLMNLLISLFSVTKTKAKQNKKKPK